MANKVTVTLTSKEGKTALVRATARNFVPGLRISERTRRKICRQFGVAHDDSNPGIRSSHTVRVYDDNDIHTFTFWAPALKE